MAYRGKQKKSKHEEKANAMISNDQIALIRRVVSRDIDFNNVTDEDRVLIEEEIGDHYTLCARDNIQDEYKLCESILDSIDTL